MSESATGCRCISGKCPKQTDGIAACAGASCDIGSYRESNEDLVFASNECRLYVVLDGVGGNAGGAEASRIVLDQLRAKVKSMCFADEGEPREGLEVAVSRALRLAALDMLRVGWENPSHRNMGTVFALAFVVDRTLLYTRVGDCRIYLLRNNKLEQLTKDETYVQSLVDIGAITNADARRHPMRNVITNCASGQFMKEYPVVCKYDLKEGDTIMLTTDGVTDKLLPIELQNLLNEYGDPNSASQAIVQSAIEEGSHDNCSCVVVCINSKGETKPLVSKGSWLGWPWR